jgi:hypothetical protein
MSSQRQKAHAMPPAGVSPRAPFFRMMAVRVLRGAPLCCPQGSPLNNTLCRFHAGVNDNCWPLISGSMADSTQCFLWFHPRHTQDIRAKSRPERPTGHGSAAEAGLPPSSLALWM